MTITGNAVARRDEPLTTSTALAIRPGQEMWNDKQRAALAVLGIRDATNADLAVFMHYCQKTGLDPFSRQIYMIMRREKQGDQWVAKQTIQVGIDGFRVIRDRIAARLGITVEYEDTTWYDDDGTACDVWLWERPPAACKVTVIRDGRRFPAVVRTAAYMAVKNGAPTGQWRTQPDHMIEKCAEAFALRRAFPHDLGGIYLEDEMPAAEAAPPAPQRVTAEDITRRRQPAPEPEPEPPARSRGDRPTGSMLGKLGKLLIRLGIRSPEDTAAFLAWQAGRPGATGLDALTRDEVAAITATADKAIADAEGDTEEAASRLWTAWKQEQDDAQQAAGPDGDSTDG